MTKISFIIPCFNCVKTITETLKSIIETNYLLGDEIILIDDCSTDNTYEYLKKIRDEYSTYNIILVRHEKNTGCATGGRNTGANIATNPYLYFIDADNMLAQGTIEKFRQCAKYIKHQILVPQHIHYFLDTHKGNRIYTHTWSFGEIITLDDELSLGISMAGSGNYMIEKKFYSEIGGSITDVGGAYDSFISGLKFLSILGYFFVVSGTSYYHRYGYESTFVKDHKKNNPSNILRKHVMPMIDLFDKNTQHIIQHQDRIEKIGKNILHTEYTFKHQKPKITRNLLGFLQSILQKIGLY